ncbi:PepSY domain-containing protein [Paenisporosarcina sp. FSL H8-0542]|uniref:PepSY domain-containing protein n=1 Tax=Paenisporosarcina sp. FSL H8-0542 TaxID=2921401 RepID=UPI00315B2736
MRKKLIIPALALTLVGGAVVGTSHMMPAFAKDNTSNTNQEEHQDKENSAQLQKIAKISSKEAEAIALKEVPGTVKESELEEEDGVLVYGFEVQTTSGDVKDVKVNAKNGDIFKVENEDNDEGDGEENDDNIKNLQKRASLSSKEAEAIALKEVPGTVKDSELEDEDGVVVYDVEVKKSEGIIKGVKVDASSGKIIKVADEEEDNDDEVEND